VLLLDLLEDPGLGRGGRDAVDRDVVPRQLLAERLRERDTPALAAL
jgi:hypothetical protein